MIFADKHYHNLVYTFPTEDFLTNLNQFDVEKNDKLILFVVVSQNPIQLKVQYLKYWKPNKI